VYLFWSCRTPALPADPFVPDQERCSDDNMFGDDSEDLLEVPLLGNRVDRFEWNEESSTLEFDHNLATLRSFQNDGAPVPAGQGDQAQPPRGNHDGGVIAFGPDGKLYVIVGDLGRRGHMQNLPCGPTATCPGPTAQDDQFGGPEPDDAHLSGVILRLNDDGTTPNDNPFFAAGAAVGGEVGANIQRIFAYGVRNSFGMAFDPVSGNLWDQQNADDAFDELNLVEPGMNGVDPGHGPGRAHRAVQIDRAHPAAVGGPPRCGAAAGALASSQHRGHPRRGPLTSVHAPGARDTATRNSAGNSPCPRPRLVSSMEPAWVPSSGATFSWGRPRHSRRAGICSTST
jgi:hypothetical protein